MYLIVRRYKKWAPLVLPTLIAALKSEDIDKVKGAIHTLRIGTVEHTVARNWDYAPEYMLALFKAFETHDRVSHPPYSTDLAICAKYGVDGHYFSGTVQ